MPGPGERRKTPVAGMISTAIVGPEVVMPPQIKPCTKRVRKNARAVVLCSLLLSFWVSFVKFYYSVNSSVQYLAECRLVHSLVFSPLSVLAYKKCPQYVGEVKPPSLQWYRTFEIGIAVYLFGYPILFQD